MKKAVALFTLTVFALFSTACVYRADQDLRSMPRLPAENTKILSVVKNSGEVIRFQAGSPGRVRGPAVVGTIRGDRGLTLDLTGPFPSIKKDGNGRVYEVTDAKGQVYPVQRVIKEGRDQMTVEGGAPVTAQVSIPLSEVHSIEVRKTNGVAVALCVLGGVVVGGWLLASALASRD